MNKFSRNPCPHTSPINQIGKKLSKISALQEKPQPFTPGEPLFWDDPHISRQMLAAHLNPANDLASRRPETIKKTVAWLIKSLHISPGARILDLGCGPGLFSVQFARLGFEVTGIDYSRRSIEYATKFAEQEKLDIRYRYQNYLTLEESGEYDLALLVYGDFCPLSSDQRRLLLQNVYKALKSGGFFILDVTTRKHRKRFGSKNEWYVAENGFWKSGLHLVLEQGFDYPDLSIFLDQAIVLEDDGKISVYRNWFQDFSRETITCELENGGFVVQSLWSDLLGSPFTEDSEWIGIIARKLTNK